MQASYSREGIAEKPLERTYRSKGSARKLTQRRYPQERYHSKGISRRIVDHRRHRQSTRERAANAELAGHSIGGNHNLRCRFVARSLDRFAMVTVKNLDMAEWLMCQGAMCDVRCAMQCARDGSCGLDWGNCVCELLLLST